MNEIPHVLEQASSISISSGSIGSKLQIDYEEQKIVHCTLYY